MGKAIVILIAAFLAVCEGYSPYEHSMFSCPAGWLPGLNHNCYKVIEASGGGMNWLDGSIECERLGGHLAEPLNYDVSDFLFGFAAFYYDISGIDQYFIGLSDSGREGSWICPYSDVPPQDYFWGIDRPNMEAGNSDDCVIMVLDMENQHFFWNDSSCQEKVAAAAPICQIPSNDPTTTTTTTTTVSTTAGTTTTTVGTTTFPPKDCSSPFEEHNGFCYSFSSDEATGTEAESKCSSQHTGAHLASIHDESENQFIADKMEVGFLLGGKSSGSSWSWSDGSSFDFTMWQDGYPVQSNTRSCMFIGAGDRWYNLDCAEKHKYVCKY